MNLLLLVVQDKYVKEPELDRSPPRPHARDRV